MRNVCGLHSMTQVCLSMYIIFLVFSHSPCNSQVTKCLRALLLSELSHGISFEQRIILISGSSSHIVCAYMRFRYTQHTHSKCVFLYFCIIIGLTFFTFFVFYVCWVYVLRLFDAFVSALFLKWHVDVIRSAFAVWVCVSACVYYVRIIPFRWPLYMRISIRLSVRMTMVILVLGCV